MPDQPFTVHVDRDDLARQEMAAASRDGRPTGAGSPAAHHGAGDSRLAARQRSEQVRSGRASRSGQSRSYAFRRS
ncbi:hypothetical protein EV385_0326 [Krasilnikovia cinnamomea]|uniref:Uncharacterized protein n=1 Tax=Krasilnikovia cinnamomea TaxID=349313 RepID=A0A4Q7ZF51_9ACTN|nr:hypothetical protein [Krasilnikovia cinnamomea]RZU48609.1 hypothetical protein EV385_0326 [Krasilnikovia cinnamomea]